MIALATATLAAPPAAVTETYAAFAPANDGGSLLAAKALGPAIETFLAASSAEAHAAAKEAWPASRVSDQRTEGGFR